MWPGKGNSGGSWPPAFPRFLSIIILKFIISTYIYFYNKYLMKRTQIYLSTYVHPNAADFFRYIFCLICECIFYHGFFRQNTAFFGKSDLRGILQFSHFLRIVWNDFSIPLKTLVSIYIVIQRLFEYFILIQIFN